MEKSSVGDRDHTLFTEAIQGANLLFGIKVAFISYLDVSDLAYNVATSELAIPKQKFLKAKTAKDNLAPYMRYSETIKSEDHILQSNIRTDLGHYQFDLCACKVNIDNVEYGVVGIKNSKDVSHKPPLPIVTDIDVHYIDFGGGSDNPITSIYNRVYAETPQGIHDLTNKVINVFEYKSKTYKYNGGKITSDEVKNFCSRSLGYISAAEALVLFLINKSWEEKIKRKNNIKELPGLMKEFPLMSHGVTAGFNYELFKEKSLQKNLGGVAEALYEIYKQENPKGTFPDMDSTTKVRVVTENGAEDPLTGKDAILKRYTRDGKNLRLAPLHNSWQPKLL